MVSKSLKKAFLRLIGYSKPKMKEFIVGIFMSVLNSCVFPAFSIFLSRMIIALLAITNNPNDQDAIDDINLCALIFLIIAVAAFILNILQ